MNRPMDAREDLRLRDIGIHQPQCKATAKSGNQCKKRAVTGALVCATHGGGAPQVKAAGIKRTKELIEERLTKAWNVVDLALDDGDTNIAWKIIAAKAALDAREEEKENKATQDAGELIVLDEKGRKVDPAWAVYAIGDGSPER